MGKKVTGTDISESYVLQRFYKGLINSFDNLPILKRNQEYYKLFNILDVTYLITTNYFHQDIQNRKSSVAATFH